MQALRLLPPRGRGLVRSIVVEVAAAVQAAGTVGVVIASMAVVRGGEKTVLPAAPAKEPHDLTAIVDPEGVGARGPHHRDGDRAELTSLIDKAMLPAAVDIGPYDLTGIVDPHRGRVRGAGDLDRGELASVKKNPVAAAASLEQVAPDDLTAIVDSVGRHIFGSSRFPVIAEVSEVRS